MRPGGMAGEEDLGAGADGSSSLAASSSSPGESAADADSMAEGELTAAASAGGVAGKGLAAGGAMGTAVAAEESPIDCREVVLFSRLLRMVANSSNSLRQQIVNDESEWRRPCLSS